MSNTDSAGSGLVGSIGVWRCAALLACVLVAAFVFYAPDPDSSLRSAIELHEFGHVVAFGLVTVLVAFAMSRESRHAGRYRARTAFLAAGAALALGAAVEVAQALTGGAGGLSDVFRDAGGAFPAATMWIAGDKTLSRRVRATWIAVAIAALLPFTFPTLAALTDETEARAQFPILVSFESQRELSRFNFGPGQYVRLTTTSDGEGRSISAMQVRLPPGKYPGFVLRYFPGDWRGMRALELLLVNPDRVAFEMTVRIDDADYDYKLDLADRYNRAFLLMPGPNRIEIPLNDVAAAPRGRRLDIGRVQAVLVYAVDLAQPREIIVGPIALVR